MWQAGEVTKPVYVHFCNRIHLFDLQIKGGKDRGEARKAKQDLVTELVGSKAANRARDRPQQRKGQQARRRQASPRKPSAAAPRTSRLPRPVKRRQGNGRIIPGGTRIRKYHNKWQRLRRKRWDSLLNNKRDANSVTEGAAELRPTTQRMTPAPRKRKGKRNLRIINRLSGL